MNIGNIKARLKAARLTQRELADHLGIAPGEVSKYLSGKHKMSAERYFRIEAFLAEAEGSAPAKGVAETAAAPFAHQRPKLSEEAKDRLVAELIELGDAYRRLPRMTKLSDEEILGVDEPE